MWWSVGSFYRFVRLSIESRKNQNQSNQNRQIRRKENTLKSQWDLKVKITRLPQARENVGNQVVIG